MSVVEDNRTPNLDLPLPNPKNAANADALRIAEALTKIDEAVGGTGGAKADLVDGKVPAEQLPDTDALTEGSQHLFFTDARARAAQQVATASQVGVVRVGSGLVINGLGVLSTVGGGAGEGLPAFNEQVLVPQTNGQTTFTITGGYKAGTIELLLNGVTLYGNGDDYTAADGSNIVLSVGVTTSDRLLLRRWTTATSLPFAALTDLPNTLAAHGITNGLKNTGDTMAGSLNFSGTGRRITGDFSNTTLDSRLAFQTTTSNALSIVGVMPSGTGTISGFRTHGGNDPGNASVGDLVTLGGSEVRINSGAVGTGSYLPMTFYTGGAERMRITTDGKVGIGTLTPAQRLDVAGNTTRMVLDLDGPTFIDSALDKAGANYAARVSRADQFIFQIGTFEAMRINTGGTTYFSSGGFGYGVNAGGTVTQATSKATAVTLNKFSGQITMNNTALGAGGSVVFVVNNSTMTTLDTVLITCPYVAVNPTNYRVEVAYSSNGAFALRVTNISAGSLSEALVIQFSIIKGVQS